jgi:hypothetical protein
VKISHTLAMAKRPGVSATFHFIAVKDQHCLLYNEPLCKCNTFILFFIKDKNLPRESHFSYYKGSYHCFQA